MKIKINETNYAPLITEIKRKGRICYSNSTGETIDNTTVLDPLGTKISYQIKVDSMYKDQELLRAFWDDVLKPRKEGFDFEAPYNHETLKFKAYTEEAEQMLYQHYKGQNIWGEITLNIYPMKPQIEVLL